jgi:hypothetical protein
MLFKGSYTHFFKKSLHGAIPFIASSLLFLISWLDSQKSISWEILFLLSVILMPPFVRALRKDNITTLLSPKTFYCLAVGYHYQIVTQAFDAFYPGCWYEPIALFPQLLLAALIVTTTYYYHSLKRLSLARGKAPLSCWAFDSKPGSIKRLILFLSHYATANGLFCFFVLTALLCLQELAPQWWGNSDHIKLPLFIIVMIFSVSLPRMFCCYKRINDIVSGHSVLCLIIFFVVTVQLLTLLQPLSLPFFLEEMVNLCYNWLTQDAFISSSGRVLHYAGAMGLASLFLLGGIQILKLQLSRKIISYVFFIEVVLGGIILFAGCALSSVYRFDISFSEARYGVLQIIWSARSKALINHPVGLAMLITPLYAGLLLRLCATSWHYVMLYAGLCLPVPSFLPQPASGLVLFVIMIISNLMLCRHIIYACDSPFVSCNRTIIKAQRWIFPLFFAMSSLSLAAFIIPRFMILLVIEKFGLLFLVSLILIRLIETALTLERLLKNWYIKRHHLPDLAPI